MIRVRVRLKSEKKLAAFVVDADDHAEAIETVKEQVGEDAAGPALAVLQGGKKECT